MAIIRRLILVLFTLFVILVGITIFSAFLLPPMGRILGTHFSELTLGDLFMLLVYAGAALFDAVIVLSIGAGCLRRLKTTKKRIVND